MDETRQKIIDATMSLIRDKGYVATTTKDIAHIAGVNECTLFRKFKNKKDIVMSGIEQEKWRANITTDIFECCMGTAARPGNVHEGLYGQNHPGLC